ncbi:hypothetical protein KKF34_16835 [Myxococcota bacterium]|nr:hypothetical protein [Myxococcota bacterium]MBU1379742.1 hypothetical protein [Myxococcota bacterium]MBU1498545.1 hypothetical protein [Myxococcota bacterium]
MNRLVLFFVSVAFLSCSSSQKKGAEETATEFTSYILSDMPEEAFKLLDKDSRGRLEKLASVDKSGTVKPWEMLVIAPQAREKWSGAKKIQTLSSDDTGKIISVGAGEKNKIQLKVVREKGLWKVSLPQGKFVSGQ